MISIQLTSALPAVQRVPLLPKEIWIDIFQYLCPSALLLCSLVCKDWNLLTSDKFLWLSLLKHYFPQSPLPCTLSAKEKFKSLSTWKNNMASRRVRLVSLDTSLGMKKVACLCLHDNKIYAGLTTGEIYIYQEGGDRASIKLNGHRKVITGLQFYQGELYSSSEDAWLKVWSCSEEGQWKDKTLNGDVTRAPILALMIDKNGLLYASLQGGKIQIWDLEKHILRKTLEGKSKAAARFLRVYKHFLYAASSNKVSVFSLLEGAWVKDLGFPSLTSMRIYDQTLYVTAQSGLYKLDLKQKTTEQVLCTQPHVMEIYNGMFYFAYNHHLIVQDIDQKRPHEIPCKTSRCSYYSSLSIYCLQVTDTSIYIAGSALLKIALQFDCYSLYSHNLLQKTANLLTKLTQALSKEEKWKHLMNRLPADFRKRFYQHFAVLEKKTQCLRLKGKERFIDKEFNRPLQAIYHIQIDLVIEMLFHAIYREDQEELEALLKQLETLYPCYPARVFYFSARHCLEFSSQMALTLLKSCYPHHASSPQVRMSYVYDHGGLNWRVEITAYPEASELFSNYLKMLLLTCRNPQSYYQEKEEALMRFKDFWTKFPN